MCLRQTYSNGGMGILRKFCASACLTLPSGNDKSRFLSLLAQHEPAKDDWKANDYNEMVIQ